MKTFKISFTGRKLGAIGKFYSFAEKVQAENEEAAILKLYDNYEHLSIKTINGKKYNYK